MQNLLDDLRSGLRMLFKYPTLSSVSILTLGLGIGLSTTVFCIVNGGLFKGLPLPDADRVVALAATSPSQNQGQQPIPVQDLAVFTERQTSFERMGAYGFTAVNLSVEEGRPERVRGGTLTVPAFEALGVQPILGRGFRAGDDVAGADPVVLLGYDLWQQRYHGDPGMIGRTVPSPARTVPLNQERWGNYWLAKSSKSAGLVTGVYSAGPSMATCSASSRSSTPPRRSNGPISITAMDFPGTRSAASIAAV